MNEESEWQKARMARYSEARGYITFFGVLLVVMIVVSKFIG